MKNRFIEHIAGILFVAAVLCVLLFALRREQNKPLSPEEAEIAGLASLEFIDYEDPFHRALFRETLDIYYPGKHDRNTALIKKIEASRDQRIARDFQRAHLENRLSVPVLGRLAIMYIKFILVYVLVMVLTYYGVQTLGVWRFVRRKRRAGLGSGSSDTSIAYRLKSMLFEMLRIFAYFILFSPAYVIAYSLRTRINTDTVPFLIVLAVISNGLLVTYAHRFYTYLVAESRKGYVDTARVKNLSDSYMPSERRVRLRAICAPVKHFTGHILEHIYANARHQYLSTIKEQASFLITGLIIIEMALNIHGHLSYEMLRQMLYHNWEIVICIMMGIFLLVKMTEITVDIMVARETNKYENR